MPMQPRTIMPMATSDIGTDTSACAMFAGPIVPHANETRIAIEHQTPIAIERPRRGSARQEKQRAMVKSAPAITPAGTSWKYG
eukprot:998493-Prymnesium_polylepis.1